LVLSPFYPPNPGITREWEGWGIEGEEGGYRERQREAERDRSTSFRYEVRAQGARAIPHPLRGNTDPPNYPWPGTEERGKERGEGPGDTWRERTGERLSANHHFTM